MADYMHLKGDESRTHIVTNDLEMFSQSQIFATSKRVLKVKVKVPLDNFSPVVFDSRGQCSSPFPSHRASVLSKDNLPWSHGQCNLDKNAVTFPPRWSLFIYSHLHAFELLGWRKLGQATAAHSVTWIRSYDCLRPSVLEGT